MLVNDLDKFDMILQAYEYESGERERERGGVLLSHFTLDQSTEGDLQQFFDSTKGTCAQSFWFFFNWHFGSSKVCTCVGPLDFAKFPPFHTLIIIIDIFKTSTVQLWAKELLKIRQKTTESKNNENSQS